MPKKFPRTLYVKTEGEGKESYFIASESILGMTEIGETTAVAKYELVEVCRASGVVNSSFDKKR